GLRQPFFFFRKRTVASNLNGTDKRTYKKHGPHIFPQVADVGGDVCLKKHKAHAKSIFQNLRKTGTICTGLHCKDKNKKRNPAKKH
ncbi:hypothetical protein, partial [Rikenella microfusus]|uniref:hypothetical protein n=1 Tax=Rikenella microfusus TaxID=28139 RepID=UPI003A938074